MKARLLGIKYLWYQLSDVLSFVILAEFVEDHRITGKGFSIKIVQQPTEKYPRSTFRVNPHLNTVSICTFHDVLLMLVGGELELCIMQMTNV